MSDRPPLSDEALIRLRHGGRRAQARLATLLARDADLRQRLEVWDRQDAALSALYGPRADEPIPTGLQSLLGQATVSRRRLPPLTRIAAALALISVGAAGGWGAAQYRAAGGTGTTLADEALRAYATYVVEVAHPVEVPGSDRAHLTTWLSKRLGHAITPPDLAGYGFALMGGRVVPDPNGTAALMMYEDYQGTRLTLYVAPVPPGRETAFRFAQRGGVRGFWWRDDDLGCALVGDLPRETLHDIAVSAYDQLIPA